MDIAIESIGQAVSNSLLMFCFCNLIIVMILRGSKQGSTVEQEMAFSSSHGRDMCMTAAEEMTITENVSPSSHESHELSIDVSRVSAKIEENIENDEEILRHGDDDGDNNEDEKERHDDDDDDGDDDDDLRKRVEEFIAKVNEEWKNEKLRALHLAIE
ncbi:PREDICTED: pheromone-processing carboxypeptidase KEX1 [Tarenaya hassleriana]|uniref:pheromone-processing carboxypeptidase KEX1 n=1 Tax=Tarenaya hassleriana TaxID=28532 RepID=UPI00053C46CD|nr:PREDICTED: pheromone-processing carboxypeptidase KEX1 [Tarenaya hassleriana]